MTKPYALAFALAVLGVSAAGTALAAAALPVASFSGLAPGAGLPEHWAPHEFASIENRTRYTLVREDGKTVLRAEARASASGVIRRMRVDPAEFPLLRWRWKVSNVLPRADHTRKDGDDFPARIYVMFDYPASRLSFGARLKAELAQLAHSEPLPLATLCYVWASKAPVGTIAPSAYTDRVKLIVVESGDGRAGQWVEFERNLLRDFEAAFGERAPPVMAIALATDTDNTGGAVTAHFGDISMHKH